MTMAGWMYILVICVWITYGNGYKMKDLNGQWTVSTINKSKYTSTYVYDCYNLKNVCNCFNSYNSAAKLTSSVA